MNWTGGRLNTYQKGGGSALVKKQKEHFAKARVKLQNSTKARSFKSFFPSGHDENVLSSTSRSLQRQTRLEEYDDVAPVAERLNRMGRQKPPRPHARHRSTQPILAHKSSTRGDCEGDATHPYAEQDPTGPQSDPNDAEIEAQRSRLLLQNDWLGLHTSKPVHIDFSKNAEREHLGKRRKITTGDLERRQQNMGQRVHVPSIQQDYHMAGGLNPPAPERMKIKIGDEALASKISTFTPTQQTVRTAQPRTQSSGSMLLGTGSMPSQDDDWALSSQNDIQHGPNDRAEPNMRSAGPTIPANNNSDDFILLEDGESLPEQDHLSAPATSDLPSSHLRHKQARSLIQRFADARRSTPNLASARHTPDVEVGEEPPVDKSGARKLGPISPPRHPLLHGSSPAPTTSQAQSHVAVLGTPPPPTTQDDHSVPKPSKSTQTARPHHTRPELNETHHADSPQTVRPQDSVSVIQTRPGMLEPWKPKTSRPISYPSNSSPLPSPSKSHMEILNLVNAPAGLKPSGRVQPAARPPTKPFPHEKNNPKQPAPQGPGATTPPPASQTNNDVDDDDDETLWRTFVFGSPSNPSSPVKPNTSRLDTQHTTTHLDPNDSSPLTTSSASTTKATAHDSLSPSTSTSTTPPLQTHAHAPLPTKAAHAHSPSRPNVSFPPSRTTPPKPPLPSSPSKTTNPSSHLFVSSSPLKPFSTSPSNRAVVGTRSTLVQAGGADEEEEPLVRRRRLRRVGRDVYDVPSSSSEAWRTWGETGKG
ncbi:MAG: hypothetical protein M1828_006535 [Chrysothrix sp. TS-e1954]|nr:MAG: hypothetical protein M1828_006535 [Chrysothrix sp. TS-e1954]